jgi:hypothetical protein
MLRGAENIQKHLFLSFPTRFWVGHYFWSIFKPFFGLAIISGQILNPFLGWSLFLVKF